ncbi:MAG: hypothetical protein ACLFR1_04855 [Spirochaetia bacterium]
MKDIFINQYKHFWRTFERIVTDFHEDAWGGTGYALTTPVRLGYHIIQSTKYYIDDQVPLVYKSGRSISVLSKDLQQADFPTQDDVLFMIQSLSAKTEKWLQSIDFSAPNAKYPWTGGSMLSVVLFLLRHSQHHLGEMNALLNEQEQGNGEDHFAGTLN